MQILALSPDHAIVEAAAVAYELSRLPLGDSLGLDLIPVGDDLCVRLTWLSGDGLAVVATVTPDGGFSLGVSLAGQTRQLTVGPERALGWVEAVREALDAASDEAAALVLGAYLLGLDTDDSARGLLSYTAATRRD